MLQAKTEQQVSRSNAHSIASGLLNRVSFRHYNPVSPRHSATLSYLQTACLATSKVSAGWNTFTGTHRRPERLECESRNRSRGAGFRHRKGYLRTQGARVGGTMNVESSLSVLQQFLTTAVPYWQTLGLELKEVGPARAVFEAAVR